MQAGDHGGDGRPPLAARDDPPRVVLVDDHALVLRATALYLSTRGAVVRTVSEPLEAATAVEEHKPTVLVLDVSMPTLSGERLWGLFRGVTVTMPRVVFYSGLGDEELAAVAQRDPTVERVRKGTDPELLWAAVLRAHRASPVH